MRVQYMTDIGDNNSDLSKTSNHHIMCFIIDSIVALIIINNIYINYTLPTLMLVSGVLTRPASPTLIFL